MAIIHETSSGAGNGADPSGFPALTAEATAPSYREPTPGPLDHPVHLGEVIGLCVPESRNLGLWDDPLTTCVDVVRVLPQEADKCEAEFVGEIHRQAGGGAYCGDEGDARRHGLL